MIPPDVGLDTADRKILGLRWKRNNRSGKNQWQIPDHFRLLFDELWKLNCVH
jgi:hypothetical protein